MSTGSESHSFVKSEEEILKFWEEQQIFQRSLEQSKGSTPYIFYDGPPFATGLPHHGHLVASTLKDIIPRYFTMQGRYVSRRFGWDCHGLPVEHEIDKKLGMSADKAVEELGIKGYNDQCRSIVSRYTEEWRKTITRLGRWVDFDNDYKTMDATFMESIWWVFKQIWEKELIYQGVKVVPFSTALGTGLANFEASSNYQEVQDPAITVLFKTVDQKIEGQPIYLAAWTTTPWTLVSNLALCVGAEIDYALVHDSEQNLYFYLAHDLISKVAGKKKKLDVIKQVKGSELRGTKYQPLFPYFSEMASEGAFQVLNDDYVSTDDGTGIVHTAPGFGEDDYRVMKSAGIEVVACPVDDQGLFTAETGELAGTYVKDADKVIIKQLKERKILYQQSVIVHSYPFCPRSDTPLIYKAIPSWYIRVEKVKERLIKSNQQISWVPEHIKEGRFGKWLEGARDWAISRNRVWGTPLPIWTNDLTGNHLCIGSIEELEKLSGTKVDDLHRENIDHLTFSLPGEDGVYHRITEVLDCWFESGSMPYAQLHYPFENQEMFEQGFPAEFIAEGLDQTRGWFYTLTVLSTILFDKPAFKNVIVNGMVMAQDGKKMSKRLKNYTAPDTLMDEYGADALRIYLITSGLVKGEEQRFTDEGVKEMVRRVLLPWFNSFKFLHTYAQVDGWNPAQDFTFGDNIVDRWLLSKLQTLKQEISSEMEHYRLYLVVPALFNFIEDLTNWYIRLNRSRFWGEGLSSDKVAAYSTLFTAVMELSTTMAPFAPFLSEYIFLELKKLGGDQFIPEQSVHLKRYPQAEKELINAPLEDAVDRMQQIILLGRQRRNQEQIKVKTPLTSLTIIHRSQPLLDEISKLEQYIKSELNVKNIHYSTEEERYIKLYAKADARQLGKRLGKRFPQFKKLIETTSSDRLNELECSGKITLESEEFSNNEITVLREAIDGGSALSNRFISIDLDTKLTAELISEGIAREIVNRIQKSRKELDLNVSDRISINYSGDSHVVEAITTHGEYISQETLSTSITCVNFRDNEPQFKYQIEQDELQLTINKIS
ncbi:MAG: isoleucine--tRNA ligase [Bdellovibrionales bacterium]|nr:isoleucine--tRNA ligase [Bdellovibrionales bacterium]